MLTISRGAKSCNSCRSQLLSLFEHGLSGPAYLGQRDRPSRPSRRLYLQRPIPIAFSTTRRQLGEIPKGQPLAVSNEDTGNMEEVVRNARAIFGDTMPKDFLSEKEYLLYERLYGPPIRETRIDDLVLLNDDGNQVPAEEDGQLKNTLMMENAQGGWDNVEPEPEIDPQWSIAEATVSGGDDLGLNEALPESSAAEIQVGNPRNDTIQVRVNSQRAAEAVMRLQRDMDAALARHNEEQGEMDEEVIEEDEEGGEEEPEAVAYLDSDSKRAHPYTQAGRFGTSPSTLTLPEENFVAPITELLSRTNNKHLLEAAERAFGGPGLPHSASTLSTKRGISPKHIGLDAAQHKMSEIEADAYLAAVLPGTYAAAMSAIVEVRKRLGASWIRNLLMRNDGEGPRILDAGAGGAGIIAWRQVLSAELDVMRSEGLFDPIAPIPEGKSTVLMGSSALRHRMSRLLDNTTFLPRLPDYVHSVNSEYLLDSAPAGERKSYDIIIAPHLLLPLSADHKRKYMVQNLWSLLDPNGGVLILVEKGLQTGFEVIAGARALLLKHHISSPGSTHTATLTESTVSEPLAKETGMIIAPCTNHAKCPMYKIEGHIIGRKDFCYFSQRFERPGFLQALVGSKHRNHEDVKFSYLAVQRGIDLREASKSHPLAEHNAPTVQGEEATAAAFAGYEGLDPKSTTGESTAASAASFSIFSLPLAILPPLKGRGHITLDLCTPSGSLERWMVPKSFSSQAFRDARKSSHGDLWALGAKTRIVREARLVRRDGTGMLLTKGYKPKEKNRWKKKKKDIFEIEIGEQGMEGMREVVGGRVGEGWGKRTKRGRTFKGPKKINVDDMEDYDDDY